MTGKPTQGTAPELSDGACELLRYLGSGDGGSVGIPTVLPGSMAAFAHAQAYFDNAAKLCTDSNAPDFAVFGALYCVRHGLELWFKGLLTNARIDRALESIFNGARDVDAIANVIGITEKRQKEQLMRSLCVLRNYLQDGLTHPRCHTENMTSNHAVDAIGFIVSNPNLERFQLALCWNVATSVRPPHSLGALWSEVGGILGELFYDVRLHHDSGEGKLWPPEDVASMVNLLHYYDPSGDAFRYPASLEGEWYTKLPGINLPKLADAAHGLAVTMVAYEYYIEEAYQHFRFCSAALL